MNNLVVLKNKQATTTSLIVAEYFGKRHEKVMRDIENLRLKLGEPKIGSTKHKGMFNEISIINSQNKKQTIYQMDRDGFMLLVMGFTEVVTKLPLLKIVISKSLIYCWLISSSK